MLRVDRASSEFLGTATRALLALGCDTVYSPALHPSTTRQWRANGYLTHELLDIMERALPRRLEPPDLPIVEADPLWDEVLSIDRLAFDGFWGMSSLGLQEAYTTNKTSILLTTEARDGYAIAGTQWGVTYLHRIAVHPQSTGAGIGTALIRAAMLWGRAAGGRVMLLNVRPDNARAQSLYERLGFAATGTRLEVLRHEAS